MNHLRQYYGSSDSESDTESLPEFPDAILDKYHLMPSMNMNRTAVGFNSFVYLEWRPNKFERLQLTRLLLDFHAQCNEKTVNALNGIKFEPTYSSSLGSPEPLHVSLSRSLQFRDKMQRDQFQKSLSTHLASSRLEPIDIEFEPKFQVLDSRFKDSLFLTLPVVSWQRSRWFRLLYQVIWKSLREAWPDNKDIEIDDMICSPDSVHMTIAQTREPVRASDLASRIELLEPLRPLPRWKVTNLKLDKNRESIKIPLVT